MCTLNVKNILGPHMHMKHVNALIYPFKKVFCVYMLLYVGIKLMTFGR